MAPGRTALLGIHFVVGSFFLYHWHIYSPYCGILILSALPVTAAYAWLHYYHKLRSKKHYDLLPTHVLGSVPLPLPPACTRPLTKYAEALVHSTAPRIMYLATLLLVLISAALIAAGLLIHFSVWCAYPRGYRQKMCDSAHRVAKIMDDNNIRIWLAMGSLLGAVRHNGQPIPWEHDMDMGFPLSSFHRVVDALRAHNIMFEVGRQGTGIRIPFDDDDEYYKRDGEPKIIDLWGYDVTEKWVQQLERRKFCAYTFWSPPDVEALLKSQYGPNYMTPMFDHLAPLCTLYMDE
jgi:hypothetical protein